jgi:hypothetical protein
MLEFSDFALGLVTAYLFIERVKKLLTRGRAGEGGAVEQRAAEAAKVEKSFGRAIERHSHAIEQVDDAWSGFAHRLDRRLVSQKIAAVNCVIEMLPGGVTFAFKILGGVDAALGAD